MSRERRALWLVAGVFAAWLVAAPAAAQTFSATEDTFVSSDFPGDNFGAFSFAEVGVRDFPKDDVTRALLAFDLSGFADVPIESATLQLFITNTSSDPLGLAITVATLASSFDENTVTWTTQPAVLPAPTAMGTMNTLPGDVFEIDVTALVEAQRLLHPDSVLLRIAATDETTDETRFFQFRTKESEAGVGAQLVIRLGAAAAPLLSSWQLALAAAALLIIAMIRLVGPRSARSS